MSTVILGATPVEFTSINRQEDPTPVVITALAPIGLTREDLVAALYLWAGEDPDELTDTDYVRYLIVSSIIDRGTLALATTKHEITQVRPGTDAHTWLLLCRTTIDTVFGALAPAVGSRVLAGVA